MKSVKLILAVAAMALTMAFAGCGKGDSSTDEPTKKPDTTNPNTTLPDPEGAIKDPFVGNKFHLYLSTVQNHP